MRLLNTTTLQFKDFYDNPPRYAILSHRWEDEEVSYKDVEEKRHESKRGWAKIVSCCKLAASRKLKYAWVDTCCIDKTSSAELTEAINSMYKWYESATECYAFLSDVRVFDLAEPKSQDTFRGSAWFTRGWTLQELIAPARVLFYNRSWSYLGSKDALYNLLQDITGVDADVLSGQTKPYQCTVAQRMSWAAQRTTSRVEDRAYSLLGIFGVNMPMLYGEGDRAFRRLQQEIISQSDDHTIFAWRNSDFAKPVLAPSPSCFVNSEHLTRIFPTNDTTQGFHLVNAGLSIELQLLPWTMNTYLAPLRCGYLKVPSELSRKASFRGYSRACLFLQQTDHDNQFTRVSVEGQDMKIIDGDDEARMREELKIQRRHVLLRQPNGTDPIRPADPSFYGFKFLFDHPAMFVSGRVPLAPDVLCYHKWKPREERVIEIENGGQHAAGLLRLSGFPGLYMYLGFDNDFAPLCLISSKTPQSNNFRRFSMLPSDFTNLSKAEAVRLLDLKWLRDEIARDVQPGETIVAFKGDRRTRSQIECKSLSLMLTFERRKSKQLKLDAWYVIFELLRPSLSVSGLGDDIIVRGEERNRPSMYTGPPLSDSDVTFRRHKPDPYRYKQPSPPESDVTYRRQRPDEYA